ncbi:MAG: DUF924 domain-containing protein [Alphaproteobacteria bacterium]|nr:MAG: DUF924 domain-containing protein [Alphaproteobacteria bacterium]
MAERSGLGIGGPGLHGPAGWDEVLRFWIEEVGPERWYRSDEALDREIRERFEPMWEMARHGKLDHWQAAPRKALALILLLDQFPRNMFRGTEKAFMTDAKARKVAKMAIDHDFDLHIPEPERQFFYLPLMHSECLADQERCVRLFKTRMPRTGAANLPHARAHREEIRRFGRFPERNAALHRATRPAEQDYLEHGGYGGLLRAVSH